MDSINAATSEQMFPKVYSPLKELQDRISIWKM